MQQLQRRCTATPWLSLRRTQRRQLNTPRCCSTAHQGSLCHQKQLQQTSGRTAAAAPLTAAACDVGVDSNCDSAISSSSGSGGGRNNTPPRWGRGGQEPWGDNGGAGDGAGHSEPWPSAQQLLQRVFASLAALLLPALAPAAAAASTMATSKAKSKALQHQVDTSLPSWELDAFVDRMWDLSGPILNNMGFSGLLGACAAAALKWVGRTVAASLGVGLILIQVLSHYNVITVNWSVVHKQAVQVLDRTGDGRLDQDDFKRVVKQGLIILSEGVPSLSGFLVGFLVGMKVF